MSITYNFWIFESLFPPSINLDTQFECFEFNHFVNYFDICYWHPYLNLWKTMRTIEVILTTTKTPQIIIMIIIMERKQKTARKTVKQPLTQSKIIQSILCTHYRIQNIFHMLCKKHERREKKLGTTTNRMEENPVDTSIPPENLNSI